MKENGKESKNKSKMKITIISVSVAVIVFIAALVSYRIYVKNKVAEWDNLIYPQVIVESTNIGGMTKEEAKKELEEKYGKAILEKKLEVKANDKTYVLDYSKLNARYNIEDTVNKAFELHRDKSLMDAYKFIKNGSGETIKLDLTIDNEYVKEFIKTIADENNKEAKNATISINGGKISVADSTTGNKVDEEDLENKILEKINGELGESISLEAKIDVVEPSIKGESLKRINGKMSTYSTNFASSASGRASNVELSTKAINGTVVMPGETFSYNEVVGERTRARGYQDAGVIVGNKVENGLGGGICQTSSTLYQAIIRSGLKSVERYNHSLVVGYLPKGFDATVSWGGPDYKFKNTYDFPIYIEGYVSNRNLIFNVYGDTVSNNKTYDFTSEVYETLTPTTQTIQDPNLPEGQTITEKSPTTGYRVKTYLHTYENGTLVKTEQISNDTYQKVDGVVKVGTKKVQAPPEQPETPPADNGNTGE